MTPVDATSLAILGAVVTFLGGMAVGIGLMLEPQVRKGLFVLLGVALIGIGLALTLTVVFSLL